MSNILVNYDVIDVFDENQHQTVVMGIDNRNYQDIVIINKLKRTHHIDEAFIHAYKKVAINMIAMDEGDDEVIIINKYEQSQLLSDYLQEINLAFDERIQLAKNFLIQLHDYEDFDYPIQKVLINQDQLTVAKNKLIFSNYVFLKTLDESIDKRQVFADIADILDHILSLHREQISPGITSMTNYLDHLRSHPKEGSYNDVYNQFKVIASGISKTAKINYTPSIEQPDVNDSIIEQVRQARLQKTQADMSADPIKPDYDTALSYDDVVLKEDEEVIEETIEQEDETFHFKESDDRDQYILNMVNQLSEDHDLVIKDQTDDLHDQAAQEILAELDQEDHLVKETLEHIILDKETEDLVSQVVIKNDDPEPDLHLSDVTDDQDGSHTYVLSDEDHDLNDSERIVYQPKEEEEKTVSDLHKEVIEPSLYSLPVKSNHQDESEIMVELDNPTEENIDLTYKEAPSQSEVPLNANDLDSHEKTELSEDKNEPKNIQEAQSKEEFDSPLETVYEEANTLDMPSVEITDELEPALLDEPLTEEAPNLEEIPTESSGPTALDQVTASEEAEESIDQDMLQETVLDEGQTIEEGLELEDLILEAKEELNQELALEETKLDETLQETDKPYRTEKSVVLTSEGYDPIQEILDRNDPSDNKVFIEKAKGKKKFLPTFLLFFIILVIITSILIYYSSTYM